MIRTSEWCWRYWHWYVDRVNECIRHGIPGHGRQSQRACQECWADLINKIRTDAIEDPDA